MPHKLPTLVIVLAASAVSAACAARRTPTAAVSAAATAPAVATAPAPSTARQALLGVCERAHQNPTRRTYPHADLDAILWQQTAAEYQANATTVYRAATNALKGLVDAAGAAKPPVVVFDLDETVLDNSRFQGRELAEARSYDSGLWDCWVGQKQALKVAGAELLFAKMAELNVRGRFVTNRKCRDRGDGVDCPQKAETLENLNALLAGTGYVATEGEMLLSGDLEPGTQVRWEDEKQPRRDFVAETNAIVMLVGDDLGDFLEGVRRTTIAARAAKLAAVKDRWGTSWFVLPNPSYGSWSAAVDEEAASARPRKRHEVVEAFPYPKE